MVASQGKLPDARSLVSYVLLIALVCLPDLRSQVGLLRNTSVLFQSALGFIPFSVTSGEQTLKGRCYWIAKDDSHPLPRLRIRKEWNDSVVVLDPDASIHGAYGVRGIGLLLAGSDQDAGVLYSVRFAPEGESIQELVRVEGLQMVAAMDCNLQEKALYITDSRARKVFRIPVLSFAPLALGTGDQIVSARIPGEEGRGDQMRFTSLGVQLETLECDQGGFLDWYFLRDGFHRWSYWRITLEGKLLSVKPISELDRFSSPDFAWQFAVAGESLRLQGRHSGRVSIDDLGARVTRLHVDYAADQGAKLIPLEDHKLLLGRWIQAYGVGLDPSPALFAMMKLGADQGWDTSAWEVHIPAGIFLIPGSGYLPMFFRRRAGAEEASAVGKLAVLAECVDGTEFWEKRSSWLAWGPAATVTEVEFAELALQKGLLGIKVPAEAKPGDVCKWQFRLLAPQDAGWRTAATSCVFAAGVHGAPRQEVARALEADRLVDLAIPKPERLQEIQAYPVR